MNAPTPHANTASPDRPRSGRAGASRLRAGLCAALGLTLSLHVAAPALASTTYGQEAKTRLQHAERVAPLTDDAAFGEQVSLFNGGLSFRYVDVSLPGNDSLKVELARVFDDEYSPNFWAWDIDVPKITSVMPTNWSGGWTADPPASVYNANGAEFHRNDYWNGFRLRVDGQTTPLLYRSSDPRVPTRQVVNGQGQTVPADDTFITKSGWVFEVVPASNGPGSALIGRAPNGHRYHFNHLITDQYDTIDHPTEVQVSTIQVPGGTLSDIRPQQLPRRIQVLYASKIEDRFGNSVTFEWNGPKLQRIYANDGREISIHSEKVNADPLDLRHELKSVTAGGRTWTYTRSADQRVINPDGSQWVYQGAWGPFPITYQREQPILGGQRSLLEDIATCTKAFPFAGNQSRNLTVRAPSGAVASYQLTPMRHGRSYLPFACNQRGGDDTRTWNSRIPRFVDAWTLRSKSISGPGLAPIQVSFNFGNDDLKLNFDPEESQWVAEEELWDKTLSTKTVTVVRSQSGVAQTQRYVFGRNYSINEGQLLLEQTLDDTGAVARQVDYAYVTVAENPQQAFALAFGSPRTGYSDQFGNYNLPRRKTTITQDNASFVNDVLAFDNFVAPTRATKSSNMGVKMAFSRTEETTYDNNRVLWLLSRPARLTVDGVLVNETEFNAQGLPWRMYGFNRQLQQTVTYSNGLVQSVRDARNNPTWFNNWYRGIPRSISFADNRSVGAEVDVNGWIRSITDQLGLVTCYGYDAMGRVNRVTPPAASPCNLAGGKEPVKGAKEGKSGTENWLPTTIQFFAGGADPYQIGAGHWQRSEVRGNYNKVTYYDALWRPVVEREFDALDPTGSQRFREWRYDIDGRTAFEAYPRSTLSKFGDSNAKGTLTSYDRLGRPKQVRQHSELGLLETLYGYNPGFETSVRNPNGFTTLTRYQAFDTPDTSAPVRITAPQGVVTHIDRDVFGKPLSITRQGVYQGTSQSVTRSFVYDVEQRLCKRIEPETGSTVMFYDVAGNLEWSAAGLALPSISNCDRGLVAESTKVRRIYDALNRLTHLSFPDGRGDQVWTYTADGLAERVTTSDASGSVINDYEYNGLRLPKREVQTQGSLVRALDYRYSGNGHLQEMTYPSGRIVDFSPNALGQSTQVRQNGLMLASSARYYPNGALHRFNYGNGLVHEMTQNARGLPQRSRDAVGGTVALDDTYDYDHNGNVAAITDALPGNRGNRTMGYDPLDRLTSVNSLMFGLANYTYDALDNLRTVSVSAGARARQHTYVYDAQQRLERIQHSSTGALVSSFAFDTRGNLSSRDGRSYNFDHGNRLRDVPGVESYRYDAHGRRVAATQPGQGSIFSMYGQDGVLRHERDERVGKATDYVYLSGSLVARISDPVAIVPAAPTLTAPANSTGSYTVSWNTVSGASVYRLEEQIGSGGWTELQSGAGTSRAFSGRPAATYRYRGRACASTVVSSCSAYSSVVTVVVGSLPAPVLSAPASSSNGSYTVSWTAVSGAGFYRLEERAQGGSFGEIQNAAATSRSISGKPSGSYDYRVRACASTDVASCGGYSNLATVSVGSLPAPVLSAPATSSTGSYTVSWNSVSGASFYRLEQQIGGGSWVEVQGATATSRQFSGMANGSYGYRARSCASSNAGDCGSFSAVVTVSVGVPPGAPVLSAPGYSSSGSYVVSWSTVNGSMSYRLEEQTNGGAWSLVQNTAANTRSVSGKPNGSYGYRVRSCSAPEESSCSAYSNTVTTTVEPLPAPPIVSAPASSSTGSYTVSWSTVAGATLYRVEEQANGNPWSELQSGAATSLAVSGRSSGSHAYRARACRTSQTVDCGAYSNVATVNVSLVQAPPVPSLTGPGSETTDFEFTLTWTASSGASYYELEWRRNSGSWFSAYSGPATSHSRQEVLVGSYDYRVRACSASACSAFSNVHTVSITGTGGNPPPPVPTLTAPATSNGSHTLSWTFSNGASVYRLEEQLNGGGWTELVVGGNTSHAVSGRNNGQWGYRVRACIGLNLSSCSAYSNPMQVQVATQPPPPPPAAPSLSAPASSSTGSYTLSWNAVSGATAYRLEEQVNGGAWSELQNGASTSRAVSGKTDGNYGYRVRACANADVSSCGSYSSVVTVMVSIPGAQIPATPGLGGPGASTNNQQFTLSWSASNGASHYELERNRNGGVWSQIYSGAAINHTRQEGLAGSYGYRVRACSAAGCSAWSPTHFVNVTASLD
jgi:hypothetical protein